MIDRLIRLILTLPVSTASTERAFSAMKILKTVLKFRYSSPSEELTLSDINLDIPQGTLVAIVGRTGEGKTSLVSAMLGELPPLADTNVVIRGKVAYVPQVSWIFNATVRQNILFGSAFDPTRYSKAIDVTALRHDLDLLPGSDLTEIGERGINISGGQKQRVSMARAVFEKCIKEELRGKTRVLVTNQLHFLSQVDRVILVHEGKVKEEGTFEELSNNGQLFQKLMENAGKLEEYVEDNEEGLNIDNKISKPIVNGETNEVPQDANQTKKNEGKSILIKQEERETGVVSWKVLDRSPVYAQFGEALNGLSSIRAYKAYDRMAKINADSMDNNIRFTLVNMSGNRWLAIRLETLGGVMIWLTATFAVVQNGRAANQEAFASTMGLLLSYALNITSLLTAVLRLASLAENSLNAVERVGTYIELPPEGPSIIEYNRPPPGWPTSGSITFKDVVLRYRPELPPVLHGLSFSISPTDKVGIVG
ncbi:hypothetical protein AgCh_040285 [Apium graveolens]